MKYTTFDAISKLKGRIQDTLLFFYWKSRLGRIGKESKIKGGVKVVGNAKRIAIGNNFKVWHRCFVTVGTGNIVFGDNGHLGVDVYINAFRGNITIGNNVSIAPKSQIYSYSDAFASGTKIGQVHKIGNVTIEDNVLIGSGAIILPGITIHEGAVIGAGAVVTKDVAPFEVVGGIPAKRIKIRK